MNDIENSSHPNDMYYTIESKLKDDGYFVFSHNDLKTQGDESLLRHASLKSKQDLQDNKVKLAEDKEFVFQRGSGAYSEIDAWIF